MPRPTFFSVPALPSSEGKGDFECSAGSDRLYEFRRDLFPGYETVLRSRPTAKALRVAIGPGVALFSFEPRAHGRTKVTVTHGRLRSSEDVEEWKPYWVEWLEALHDPDDAAVSDGVTGGARR